MREGYDAQQVCLNGHQQTDRYYGSPEFRREFCEECGASTVHKCSNCLADILGDYSVPGVIAFGCTTPVPPFCRGCGVKFPWTDRLIASKASDAVSAIDPKDVLARLCTRFSLVVRELRHRHDNRPTLNVVDEYDVQDLLHSALHLFFDDVRAEEVVPSYAGKSTRMDFLLKDASISVEAKMTRKGLGAKEVGEQLILDIAQYQSHPSCKSLFCLVYDPEHRVRNPRGIETDLSKTHGELEVRVFVVS
ncbi:DUF2321 domain-containing protein [Aquabacterium sp.]|uniref:DUF2321 domain-containing protein n=1 Tax=Aquabacterium sp. TaxID=1872578 RepID=UPI0024890C60|nr:DUF2321 domain-containing protein [Aquabacterium sp.]MDI1258297.1 DUF2321 domain-containing protein [Aquabacterium sp.]